MDSIFRFFFRLFGWKVVGEVSPEITKAIYAVCPHWNNKDFFVGLGTRAAMRRKIRFLGKAELFKAPFGFIFRALDGIPVYRKTNMNMVESMTEAVKNTKEGLICIAPEGTRKNVAKLKSGFYHIAMGANIPIIMVGFDWKNKQATVAEPFYPTGNYEEDMLTYFVPFFEKIEPNKDWIQNYKDGNF